MFEQYSTRTTEHSGRLDYWNGLIGGIFPGMVVDSEIGIDACWSQCSLGDINFAIADSPRARIARWHSQVPNEKSGRVLVHLQNVGHSVTYQHFRDAALNPGDFTFCLPNEPYELHISDRNQAIVLDLPERRLTEMCPDWEVARTIASSQVGSAMLRRFLASLRQQCWGEAPQMNERQVLGDIVWQLLQLSLSGGQQAHPEGRRDMATQVMDFVERHLTDADLSTSTIARALSLSPRAVQNVFASMATTPTEFILTRRLNRSAEMLASGSDFGSITDLAFDVGFNDSAYFARRFRRKFGLSPSAFRANRRN